MSAALIGPHTDHRRARAAFHEAGHAVAARLHRIRVDHLSVVPDGQTHGRVLTGGRGRPTDHVVVSWAGPLAEERAVGLWSCRADLPDHLEAGYLPSWVGDSRYIRDATLAMCSSERTAMAFSSFLRLCALDLLQRPEVWAQVTAVATGLWEHGELSGRQFHHLCRGVAAA
jgi:hypothetical protein